MLRGCYIHRDYYSSSTFSTLQSKGLTDLIGGTYNINRVYKREITNINLALSYLNGIDLNFHVKVMPWWNNLAMDNDSGDEDYWQTMADVLLNVCNDCPGITGINFDDMTVTAAINDKYSESEKEENLEGFLQTVTTTVHDEHPNIIFSGNVPCENNTYGVDHNSLLSIVNYIQPSALRVRDDGLRWVESQLDLVNVPDRKRLIANIGTYYVVGENSFERDMEDIKRSIDIAFKLGYGGYVLLRYSPNVSLNFPQRRVGLFGPGLFFNNIK